MTTKSSSWKTYKVVVKDSSDIIEAKARSLAELLKKYPDVSWVNFDGQLIYTSPDTLSEASVAPTADNPTGDPTFTQDAWGEAAQAAYERARADERAAIESYRADTPQPTNDNPLGWTGEELEEIRNDVFGSCTYVDECYTLPELQAELTWYPKWDGDGREVPTPYRTKSQAIKSLLSTEIARIRYEDTGGDPKIIADRKLWIKEIQGRVNAYLSANKKAVTHKPKLALASHLCLCGCGTSIWGKSLFKQGHDAKVARVVRLLERGKITEDLVSQAMLDLYRVWIANGKPGGTAHPKFLP